MKPISLPSVITFIFSFLVGVTTQAQTFGPTASAVWISDCNQSNYFNTSGSGSALIGLSTNVFTNANLGAHTQNSGTLVLRGGEVRTFKTDGVSNVCIAPQMHYRIYPQSATPGAFSSIDLVFMEDCDVAQSKYPSEGACVAGQQKWNHVFPDGAAAPYSPINLTSFAPGNYVLEVYYEIKGSATTTSACDETVLVDNAGSNYKAFFSIQAPVLTSTNPTTCNGTDGTITISGLVPTTSYTINYKDDGIAVGPANFSADGSGKIVIGGLDAGTYSNITVGANGCTTQLPNVVLSSPVFVPVLASNNPITCNGTEGAITINGLTAGSTYSITYSDDGVPIGPANFIANGSGQVIIPGLNAGIYSDFEVSVAGCTTIHLFTGLILSNPVFTPTFPTIAPFCAGSTPPTLNSTSNNGITGTWSPSVIDNMTSGAYVFTPTAGQCGMSVTKNVVVKPIVVPTFSFGTSLTICAGATVPSLPTTSSNSIAGTWSPSTIDNQNSGTYIFTPTGGQCALPTTLLVTIAPNVTPVFSIGTTLTICAGASVPALPSTSTNGINGVWSPSTITNQASGTYTFTPDAGQCATTASFSVTVIPNITPTFSFGTSLTICNGATVPALPTTSDNSIAGTWSPSTIDNQNSATYTFTPTAGQCALPATLTITVNPNITPTFGFGTSLTICAGGTVPTLATTSTENITGVWSPSVVDNQASGTYTFTPSPGECATATTFTVTVTPNITPTFSIGTTLTICSGAGVPALPLSSDNGITGTWNPSVVDNTNSGVYTFTPTAGECATTATFTVTVNANVTPTFSFGTSLTICSGATAPALPSTSDNSITGSWSPATVDNQTSGTYTFTPAAGVCALPATFTVTVSANITPTFGFGTSLTICAGGTVPTLATTSTENITGVWSPSVVDNQASGMYTFTPTQGQCALPATFSVTVTPNITPVFGFGTTLTICAGATVPSLPTTSDNNISGTWSASTIDNQTSATYTFTPTAGVCALPVTFSVTVTPNITPTFSFGSSLSICAGGAVPALPSTSGNAVTGVWSPSVVDNQNSGTYTFTPGAGQCALPATFNVTITPNITPTFSFGTSLIICEGTAVPVLVNTSDNNITGTWNASVVDNQISGTYNFTPDAGQCALPLTFAVTVRPIVTPVFGFGTSLTICAGGTVPTLATTSTENITGVWSPSVVDNQASGTYTFTPSPGECATATTFTVTVTPNITPTFSIGTTLTICSGAGVPALPLSSDNGITGTWNPSVVDNTNSGVYTFTPTAGECATTATFTVTVNANVTPTFSFGTSLTICSGATAPALPSTSDNSITGSWSPATVDNQTSGTYTFTPAAGVCALPATFTVTVSANITPTFGFGTSLTICAGGTVPTLATTSTENITGVWSPSVVDNQASGTYTFTPTQGQCALPATYSVTVTPNITPVFGFGTTLTICAGATVPSLPTTSDNNISGTWSASTIDNQTSATYTFTPTAGVCALPVTFSVTVTPNITPTFSFGSSLSICAGGAVPALPSTSGNAVTGVWSPSVVDNQNSGTYTFTPGAGQCALPSSLTVTVNPIVTPTFNFGTSLTICSGSAVPSLTATSNNGISGSWSPSSIDNQNSGTYTFTPGAEFCATPAILTVTVTPTITPTFSFGTQLNICTNGIVPELPLTSTNGITGVWSPSVVSSQASGIYTFTPTSTPEQCITTATFAVTVNPILTPAFSFGTALTLCAGSNPPSLPSTSLNGINGTWSPATINNQASGTYTFTSSPGQCATETATLNVTVNPVGVVNASPDITVNDGANIPLNNFTGTPAAVSFNWINSNTAIGLTASGTGNVPSFTAVNKTDKPVTATITVTPMANVCAGSVKSYVITVNPLDKDVFVPNVFSPNGDGKNELLLVYGSYINKLEMRIFNQWGEQVELVTDKNKGWDGRHNGKAQPVGVYVYTLKATMQDGRVINLKGYITLLR